MDCCSEQSRRKTVTQSHGATADCRHASRAASDAVDSVWVRRPCFLWGTDQKRCLRSARNVPFIRTVAADANLSRA